LDLIRLLLLIIHAYNNKDIYIEEFNIIDLINANEYDLYDIVQMFGLKEVNKANKVDIMEILFYFGKLYNLSIFNNIPNDEIFYLLIEYVNHNNLILS